MSGPFEGLGRPVREPSQGVRNVASLIHEHYTALVMAGFTEEQAIDLVKTVMLGAAEMPDEEGGEKGE